MKRKFVWVLLFALLATAIVYASRGDKEASPTKNNTQTGTNKPGNQSNPPPSNIIVDDGNTISGVLRRSDNSAKGNLMIVTSESTVYLRTSRDFSALLDQEVVATIDGTLTSFTLIDIQAN